VVYNFIKQESSAYIDWFVTDKAGINKTARVPNLPNDITNFIPNFNNVELLWTEVIYFTWPETNLTMGEIINYELSGWIPNDVPVVDVKFLDIYLGNDELKIGKQKHKIAKQSKKGRLFNKKVLQ
ncbi:MAG: hypothetical protein MUF68_09700, partial [Cyclobacteriaceae bacterium]|nr:hypothetical protein [Cyclobacteriaceae bacterium]